MYATTQLPEDPTKHLVDTITHIDTVAQTIHDATIPCAAGAARQLEAVSNNASQNAVMHSVAQVREETQATTSNANADLARTDAEHDAKSKSAVLHDISAQSHHVKGNSDAIKAQVTGAKASALEQESKIEIVVAEAEKLKITSQHEVEDRTNAALKQEMRVAGVIQEEDIRQQALDLEAQAQLAAKAGLGVPKI